MQQAGKKYDIRMQGNSDDNTELEISCIGAIGDKYHVDWYLNEFKNNLQYQVRNGNFKSIRLLIHSEGGCVFTTYAMIGILKSQGLPITAHIIGLAASAATILMLSADTVVAEELSSIMIHNPSSGGGGEAKDLRKTADRLDQITNEIAKWYAKRSKLTEAEALELMAQETWFTPQEALEKGLIDFIVETPKRVQNSFSNTANHSQVLNDLNTKKGVQILNYYNVMITNKNNTDEIVAQGEAQEIADIIRDLKDQTETLTREKNALQGENAKLTNKMKEDLLDYAEHLGKINRDVAARQRLLKFDYDTLKEHLSAMKSRAILKDVLTIANKKSTHDWTLEDWQTKDYEGLQEMQENNPEQFKKLYNDWLAKKKSESPHIYGKSEYIF